MRNRIVGVLLLGLFIKGCGDPEPRLQEYPIFTTTVSDVDSTGVTFNAEVLYLGSASILNHGFVWGDDRDPSFDIFLFQEEFQEEFSQRITEGLNVNAPYSVRSFVIIQGDTAFSNIVSFTSLGPKTKKPD